ncbi:MAG: hypothetical protein R3Y43_06490 [Alphaproteobacteria bacterium]
MDDFYVNSFFHASKLLIIRKRLYKSFIVFLVLVGVSCIAWLFEFSWFLIVFLLNVISGFVFFLYVYKLYKSSGTLCDTNCMDTIREHHRKYCNHMDCDD